MANTEPNFGVDETMQMLQFREQLKGQMTPEQYTQVMDTHKASIQTIIATSDRFGRGKKVLSPVEAAEIIVDLLDDDKTLDDDQREMWKVCIVVAAFEMSEF